MVFKRLFTPLGFFVGAFFVCQNGSADTTLTDTLTPAVTVQADAAAPEPFVIPLASKKAKAIGFFGKRDIPDKFVSAPPGWPSTTPSSNTAVTAVSAIEPHEGIDYAAPVGTLVRASRAGKVIFAGFSKMYVSRAKKTEQHRLVIIRHSDGMSTRYVHLSGLRVRPGQDVEAKQTIGAVAESDEWTQPVLHFEIRGPQGQSLDPAKLIGESSL